MAALGVADPEALARRNAAVLAVNWLKSRPLANLLVLQRVLG
jgi:hypothetical protein